MALLIMVATLVETNGLDPRPRRGWPFLYTDMSTLYKGLDILRHNAFVFNTLASLVLLVCTAIYVECWIRRRAKVQLDLKGLFMLTFVAAVMVALWRFEHAYASPDRWDQGLVYAPLLGHHRSWFIWSPILFGIACTVSTAGWLIAAMTGLVVKAMCRPQSDPGSKSL